jgi:GH15 family glucan-1,4-alpha-glucosidase
VEIVSGVGAVFTSSLGRAVLRADVPLKIEEGSAPGQWGVAATFTLEEGQTVSFHLEWNGEVRPIGLAETDELFTRTSDYWQGWLSQSRYRGRWREMVHRSALALKLLVYHPTGALVAAPTTSLPEEPGGTRNWDYRYSWLRDAAFTIYALMRLGFLEEAGSFMEWIQKRCETATRERDVMIMYTIDGSEDISELVLDHLEGYRGASPVRIGNGAAGQRQIDVYGELMDSVYLFNKEQPISYDLWTALSKRLDWLAAHWQEPDEGIWEIRGPRQRFTYSALMTWVAYERALRLARDRGLPAPMSKWRKLAASAYRFVQESCWDPAAGAYMMYPGSQLLDASLLVMPLVKFSGPTDPRFLSTLDRISAELASDSLVNRYAPTGVDGITSAEGAVEGEGTFNLCSFWYVEALTRAGRVREARWTFEKMLTYANHLGLFAEQIGASGEALGNFPQAFTHLALISAAANLDSALDKR